ncbi:MULTISPECIES: DUF3870 domain-containing protein [unclassified Clostridium]|uniref:DUF3870 domain-containing protein n=1 Tax=unclassified Clostridium TaxID=2614128 RepID=UPI00052DE9BA|nr:MULTISPECIES: DUF3870 domain-containing protein [unclassified Clostridium]KGK90656.1 hypothetical protein DP68_00230 [Clostridium sp. HMP27]
MKYEKNTIYITGIAHSNSSDPITVQYNIFFLGVIINKDTSQIVDIACNAISPITVEFIKSIIIEHNIVDDIQKIICEIQERFFGTSQKALIVALKDVHNKYLVELKKHKK